MLASGEDNYVSSQNNLKSFYYSDCTDNSDCPDHLACYEEKCKDPGCPLSCAASAHCEINNSTEKCQCNFLHAGDPYNEGCTEGKGLHLFCSFYMYIVHCFLFLQNARMTQTVLIMLIVIHKNMAYRFALAILVTLEMQLLKAVKVTIEKFMRKLFTFLGM